MQANYWQLTNSREKKPVIKRSLEKTPLILKTAMQQQHSLQQSYARTLKSVRKAKWKSSEKINKNNLFMKHFYRVIYSSSL